MDILFLWRENNQVKKTIDRRDFMKVGLSALPLIGAGNLRADEPVKVAKKASM